MTADRAASVSRSTFLSLVCLLPTAFAYAAPPVLTWNGASGEAWNATATNWLNESAVAVTWQPGAEATFVGAGGLVNVSADLLVSNITFASNGYALLGAGRLTVEGTLAAAAGTTNSIASGLLTAGGLSKTGDGALALARCVGALAVQAGSLLASGSGFSDTDLSVASGAKLVTLGDPATNANLIANGSFELPAMSSGSWAYSSSANWTVTAYPSFVGRQNTAPVSGYNNPWNAANTSPDGVQMAILQYGGAIAQTVSVPANGLYSIAFSYLMRGDNRENQVYVTLDGIPLASFLNRSPQASPGRFASGALWLAAGSHTLGIGGEHSWGDRSTMVDAVCFAAPSAGNACRSFAGDSLLKVVAGASVSLEHTGTVPLAYVATNGAAASGTFNASHPSGVFSGNGTLSCSTPGNVYTWSGAGLWSESARWADGSAPAVGGGQNLLVRFPAATGDAATNDLSGEFLARGLSASGLAADGVATLAGGSVILTNSSSGAAPKISLQAPGTWTVTAPVEARATLTLEVAGQLTFQDNALGVASNGTFYKTGPGTVAFPSFVNRVATASIYDGTVQTPQIPSSLTVNLFSQPGKEAALRLTQGGVSFGNTINLMGSGTPTLATRCGGSALTCSNWTYGHGDTALFDVGADDTLSLRQMLLVNVSRGNSVTALVKSGPGTLELRSAGADTDKNRAYQGATTLRNGTLTLSEDDYGTLNGWTNPFNGRTYDGKGGSFGYSSFTNTVRIGDGGTAPTDSLALIANGNGRWIGHDIEVFNRGATVTLGMTTGTVMFAGTVTLHRDVVLSGPADGILVFSNVVAAADYAGTGVPALSGLAGLRLEGSFPAAASLIMNGRLLSFGTYAVKAQTLNALVLGSTGTPGTLNVDFGAGVNDAVAVTMPNGLVLSNTVVNLYYAGTGLPFAEPGTYTLFTYAGTLGGDAALLSIGNPQSGASYVFANDAANSRVTVTISGTSGGVGAVWKNPVSGNWGVGSNWDGGSVPDGSGVIPLFGLAITNAATVSIDSARTAGALLFNNASYGYTLSGAGGLILSTNGATPLVSVIAGSHTLDTTVDGSDGLTVSTATGASLILGHSATVNTGLDLSQGTVELRGNAAVNGATALAASTLLRAATTTNAAVGTLSGPASAIVALTGSAPKLTVKQTADETFAGMISGASDAQFVKSGSGTLTLNGPFSPFLGLAAVEAGTLRLQSASAGAAVSVGAASTLEVPAPVTNGLAGFFYNVSPNTNAFWTLAGMESHFASLMPNFAALSGATSNLFDFGVGTTFFFPSPYGSGGSRSTYFEAVWRGVITVPATGTYVFGCYGDDGFLLAIDGRQVFSRNYWTAAWTEGVVTLDAGRHDIVLGYFQMSGGGGLQLRVRPPSQAASVMVPSAWLAPYSQTAHLTGGGDLALTTPASVLRAAVNSGGADFGGASSGPAGSLLAKSGNGILSLGGTGTANAFAGDLDVQGGVLALDKNERIGDAATLTVRSGAALAVAGTETVGTVAGNGTLALGGYVYAMPFTGDTDSGISTSKTYTHLLDFPLSTANPTVNGVTFNDFGTFTGTLPGGTWNDAPNDATRSGVNSLLWDFSYGTNDFAFSLTGLESNTAYEVRLYFRNFASNPRNLTFTFTAGSKVVGSLDYNPDSVTRSWVGCRYVTDAAKSLTIRVVSHESMHTCHLYGLSNEEITGATAPVLTVSPAAGASADFNGPVTGLGGLVKSGAGTQCFAGANTLSQPLAVEQGLAVLNPGATVQSGAVIAEGATLRVPLGSVTLGSLSGSGTFDLTGAADYSTVTNGPRFVKITGDADCGISADKTYTHLLDFGGSTNLAVVNGVAFNKEKTISGPLFGASWINAPATTPHPGGNTGNIGIPSSQGIYNLINDFCYGAPYGPTNFYLTGLTTGKWYEVRFYHRKWEASKARNTTFTYDPDGSGPLSDSVSFNPDSPAGSYNDNYLAYRYLAQTNQLAITITCPNVDKYHLYGLSNEEVPASLDGSTVLALADDCVFAGAVTGGGPLTKAGAGSLTVTGNSTATGPVAVNAGAYGVAAGGRAPLGPVTVAPGATLFGDGQVGGNVSVASNGWLMAGTAASCGTLQVGGSLTLAPGARLAYRFGPDGSNDTVTVGGLLSFPTSGVVVASALATGAHPPAKDVFFTSPLAIAGPADLTGWTVTGEANCSLIYSDDRKTIYLSCPRGTMILMR